MTKSSLNRLFDDFNRRYFGGRLRKRAVRWFSGNARVSCQHLGLCTPRAIYIARHLTPERAAQTLVHEMCHIGVGKGHGPRWRARMISAKDLGAPVNPTELAKGYVPCAPGQMAIFIDDLVRNQFDKFTTWREVRRIIARESWMTIPQVERLRWPRKRWERVRKEEAEYDRQQVALCARLNGARVLGQ